MQAMIAGQLFSVGLFWRSLKHTPRGVRRELRSALSSQRTEREFEIANAQSQGTAPPEEAAYAQEWDLFAAHPLPSDTGRPTQVQPGLASRSAGYAPGDPSLASLLAQRSPDEFVSYYLELDDKTQYFMVCDHGLIRPGTDILFFNPSDAKQRFFDWIRQLQRDPDGAARHHIVASHGLDLVQLPAERTDLKSVIPGTYVPAPLQSLALELSPKARRRIIIGVPLGIAALVGGHYAFSALSEYLSDRERVLRDLEAARRIANTEVFRDRVRTVPWAGTRPLAPSRWLAAHLPGLLDVPVTPVLGDPPRAYSLDRATASLGAVRAEWLPVFAPAHLARAQVVVARDSSVDVPDSDGPPFSPLPLDPVLEAEHTSPGFALIPPHERVRLHLIDAGVALDRALQSRFGLLPTPRDTAYGITETNQSVAWALQRFMVSLPLDVLLHAELPPLLDGLPGLVLDSLVFEPATRLWHVHYSIGGLSKHYAESTAVEGLEVPLPEA